MPYASPVENAIALSQAVLHTDKAREMVANYELSSMDVDVELPDYGNLKKPLLEAFTLDSTACAACTYMWGVAQYDSSFVTRTFYFLAPVILRKTNT